MSSKPSQVAHCHSLAHLSNQDARKETGKSSQILLNITVAFDLFNRKCSFVSGHSIFTEMKMKSGDEKEFCFG